MADKGNGQKVAERMAANPFRGETTMGAVQAVSGAAGSPRYDRELDAAVWPQGAVTAPKPSAPLKMIYRHDAGGAGMEK